MVYLLIHITDREMDVISKFDILFYFVKEAIFTWVLKEFFNYLLYL